MLFCWKPHRQILLCRCLYENSQPASLSQQMKFFGQGHSTTTQVSLKLKNLQPSPPTEPLRSARMRVFEGSDKFRSSTF